MTTYIYKLIDPRNNQVKYIGKANKPVERLKAHINPARYRSTYKHNWIRQLRREKVKPIMIILEEVSINRWKEREKAWILFYKYINAPLTNIAGGGEGSDFGNKTSFKKGHIPASTGTGKPKSKNFGKGRGNHDNHKRNSGCFKKGHVSWITGLPIATKPIKWIYQYDLSENFIQPWVIKEAAEFYGCCRSNIENCARGVTKTAVNYKWKYEKL